MVVAYNEVFVKCVGLIEWSVSRRCRGERLCEFGAYGCLVGFGHCVTGVVEEYICPVAFLVDYTSEITRVVVPWCSRFTREALDSTKGRILPHISSVSGV